VRTKAPVNYTRSRRSRTHLLDLLGNLAPLLQPAALSRGLVVIVVALGEVVSKVVLGESVIVHHKVIHILVLVT